MAHEVLVQQNLEDDILSSFNGTSYTKQSVLQAIGLFYGPTANGQQVSGKLRRKISNWLESFQKSEEAWNIIMELISLPDLTVEAKIFIGQTFRQKIEYDFNQLDEPRQAALRDKLVELLYQFRLGPKSILTQLSLALADLAIQLSSWTDPVGYVAQTFGSQPEMIVVLLEFLEVLPEEIRYNRALQLDKDRLDARSKELVQAHSHNVVSLVVEYLQKMGNTAEIPNRVLSCLESWIRVGDVDFELIEKASILDIAHHALTIPDLFDHGVDILCEVIRRTGQQPRPVKLIEGIYGKLISLTQMLKDNHEDEDTVRGLCRLFVEAGEAYIDLIASTPETFQPVLEALVFCAGHEELDIVKITFNFWYLLAEHIIKPEMAAIKPGFTPIYTTLIHHILRHLQYPDDLNSWTAEERDSFREFRHVMGDVLKDCVRVLGDEQALSIPFALLQTFVKLENGSLQTNLEQWQKIEAPLFSLRAMCREVSTAESKYLPEIMAMLPHLPPHPKIKYATILVIGRYAEWTNQHPQMLSYQLDYVSQGFDNDRDTIAAAAQTFRDLCKYCSKLQPFYVQTMSKVSREERFQMTEAIAYVISEVPYQNLKEILELYSIPIASRLHESLSVQVSNDDASSSVLKDAIECVSELGTLNKYLHPDIPSGASHPGVDILLQFWPLLERLLDQHASVPKVSQMLCRLFRNSIHSYKNFMIPTLLPVICEKLAVLFEKTYLPCFLWVTGVVVSQYGSDDKPEGKLVYTLVEKMTSIVFQLVQQPNPEFPDLPEVVTEYYYLLGELLDTSPRLLITSPLLQPSFFCGLHCLALEDPEAPSTVLRYFYDLFKLANPNQIASSAGNNNDLQRSSAPLPPEMIASITSLITDHGEKSLHTTLKALASSFERDDRDLGTLAGDSIRAMVGIVPVEFIVEHMKHILQSEFSDILTDQLKLHFVESISKALVSQDPSKIGSVMNEFAITCHRRRAALARK